DFGLVIQACWRGAWEQAVQLLEMAGEQQLPLDSKTYASAMRACLEPSRPRLKAAEHAMSLYDDFLQSTEPPGIKFFVTAAAACEEGLFWEKALKVLADGPESAQVRCSVVRACAQAPVPEVELLRETKGVKMAVTSEYISASCRLPRSTTWSFGGSCSNPPGFRARQWRPTTLELVPT
ncbi:Pentatricopeptide repeat-containing protein, partial [Durusdinium trenchii]